MKAFLLTTILAIFCLSSFSQNIQNADFENWASITLYEEPQAYFTSNFQSILTTYQPNVTKDTNSYSGNYATRLETKIHNSDTAFGLITNGFFSQSDIVGGIPYTNRADTFSVWARYDIKPGDTAMVAAVFKVSGNILGFALLEVYGSQSQFSKLNIPIIWSLPTVQPDTFLFIAVSSNPDYAPKNGSWIVLDDLKLDGSNLPNGGFETWITRSYEDPLYWNTFNYASVMFPPSYVQKTTDAYHGSYAMKIITTLFNNNQDTLTHVSNGDLLGDDFMGGMATYSNPFKVSGYYKYIPVGNDSALVALRAYAFNNQGVYKNVDNNLIKLPAASSYTYFEITLSYNQWPWIDTLGIGFAASNIYDGHANAKAGSTLFIDSLNIEYYPLSVEENKTQKPPVIYPNPASEFVYIKNLNASKPVSFRIYSIDGSLVAHEDFHEKIDVSLLNPGIYIYEIGIENEIFHGKIHIIR